MNIVLQRHIKFSVVNLLIVAVIGLVLRYKIAYSLPFINQKHLLHGHSHFAFTGWITQALMALLINYISNKTRQPVKQVYKWLLFFNLITAYGMLISFSLQGYGACSIFFSTAAIITSYVFSFFLWQDLSAVKTNEVSHWWMKASLFFNILSSAGAFGLAFMMATKTIHQNWYLAAVYFFLHFQYNGWFLFACMGLITAAFLQHTAVQKQKIIFWLFAAACIPAYLLSALWLPVPMWVYVIVVAAAFSQAAGWLLTLSALKKNTITSPVKWIFILSAIALTIKLLLQLGSTIPVLSNVAFGFRPIVIGYLHLILLGVITLCLLGFLLHSKFIPLTKKTTTAVLIFAAGIIINEILLLLQGAAAMLYMPVMFINQLLLLAAAVMFTGLLMLNIFQHKKTM